MCTTLYDCDNIVQCLALCGSTSSDKYVQNDVIPYNVSGTSLPGLYHLLDGVDGTVGVVYRTVIGSQSFFALSVQSQNPSNMGTIYFGEQKHITAKTKRA